MATTITPTIVTVNTAVVLAPQPTQLQQSGAIVSTGGTTLTAGTYQYCGSLSAVNAIAATPLALTSLIWSSGTVTATASATLVQSVGQTFLVTIAGAVPAAYNGTYTATVATTTTFTFAVATNPGTETTPGTYTPGDSAFVQQAATVFFAQGTSVGVYVLELGPEATAAAAITALQTWITGNMQPQVFYAYLVPQSWDTGSSAALNTLASGYSSPTGKTYFFISTTSTNISAYTNKACFCVVPAPTAPTTEITAAAFFYQWLVNSPSAASPVPPMAWRFLYDVTPWAQTTANNTTINTVLTAFGNIVLTGAEGGLPTTSCIFKGTTMDGNQAIFWYAVDWIQIQAKLLLANAVLNGSNSNPPLYYNQGGINSLLSVLQGVGTSGIAFGLILSATFTATPCATYVAQNPANYAAGIYGGFACVATPQLGFLSITFNLEATQIA